MDGYPEVVALDWEVAELDAYSIAGQVVYKRDGEKASSLFVPAGTFAPGRYEIRAAAFDAEGAVLAADAARIGNGVPRDVGRSRRRRRIPVGVDGDGVEGLVDGNRDPVLPSVFEYRSAK